VDEEMKFGLKFRYVPDGFKTQLKGKQLVTNYYEVIVL